MASGDAPSVALPVVTYDDDVSIHFNGEMVTLIHMPQGHTDTDSVVYFEDSDVIHMGDHFFNGAFPFVDLANGGTVQGYIDNLEKVLSWISDDIRVKKSQRMSAEEIVAEGLGAELESWGQGFISEEAWINTVYNSYPR